MVAPSPALRSVIEARDPFRELIGYEYVASADRSIGIRLAIAERHWNRHGTVHGGVAPLLMAAAGAIAVYGADATVDHAANVAMNVSYLASIRDGTVWAHGRVERLGNTLAHVGARLTKNGEDGEILAVAQIVYRLVRARKSEI